MIPLTTRSHYSLMWGTASVKALCRHARRLGYDRLALTDTDNLYVACGPFLAACRREGIIPIVGAEVTRSPERPTEPSAWWKMPPATVNLCRLLTRRHMDGRLSDLATALPPSGPGTHGD
jgi:error-prone DNA polymerase